MDRHEPTRTEGDEFSPDTRDRPANRPAPERDIVRGDDPHRSEAPFGRPLGGPPPANQHDLTGGEHATDTATTYHAPPEPPDDG